MHMIGGALLYFFPISFISFLYLFSSGQTPLGAIQGKVTEDNEAAIPGALVTIIGLNIESRTVVTNEFGIYRFINIPPGTFSIKIELPGFKTMIKEDVVVQANKTNIVNFQLESYAIKEIITITKPVEEASHEDKTQEENIEEEISKLKAGKIMFNPPIKMKEGKKERVEVRISQNIKEDLTEKLKGRGMPRVEDIIVSSVMKAKLTGDKFKIDAFSEEEQLITSSGYSQWEWDLIPLKSGLRKLCLSVAVSIRLEKFGEKKKSLPVMEKEIVVKVNPKYRILNFLKRHWAWIIGTIIALVGLYFTYRKLMN